MSAAQSFKSPSGFSPWGEHGFSEKPRTSQLPVHKPKRPTSTWRITLHGEKEVMRWRKGDQREESWFGGEKT